MIGLLISKNEKKDSYNLMLVTVNKLAKIPNYKIIKTIIHLTRYAKVIINILISSNNLSDSNMRNICGLFTSKF